MIILDTYSKLCPESFYSCCTKILDITAKVCKVALPIFAGVFLSMAAGLLASSSLVIIGGVLGGAAGIALSYSLEYRSQKKERIPIPKQVRIFLDQNAQDNKVKQSYQAVLKTLKDKRVIFLNDPFDHHTLHHHIMVITDKVKENPELHKAWESFLSVKRTLIYFDKREVPLDFTAEIQKLHGNLPRVAYSTSSSDSFCSQEDFIQMKEIMAESFTKEDVDGLQLTDSGIRIYGKGPYNCIFARDRETRKILGMLLYKEDQEKCYIGCLGRRPESARLGIGKILIDTLLEAIPDRKMVLHVRRRNLTAQTLYMSCGFQFMQQEKYRYQNPDDDCLLFEYDRSLCSAEHTGT